MEFAETQYVLWVAVPLTADNTGFVESHSRQSGIQSAIHAALAEAKEAQLVGVIGYALFLWSTGQWEGKFKHVLALDGMGSYSAFTPIWEAVQCCDQSIIRAKCSWICRKLSEREMEGTAHVN